ncbi:MAG TPA: hypothetical protein VK131_04210, partial [Candidatus Acidoferrales bacterium]|nr:hypothetical protein [Candidatus Acidoferrales bacterium]
VPANSSLALMSFVSATPPSPAADFTKAQMQYVIADTSGTAVRNLTVPVLSDGTAPAAVTAPAAGLYTITTTLLGGGFFSPASTQTLLVVFDSTSSATGGGWESVPSTAIGLTPGAKANFGFVVKYLPGTTTPAGNLVFQDKVDNLDFKATGLDWMVVQAGSAVLPFQGSAWLQGTGTVNGAGGFQFRVNATQGPSTFTITIWDSQHSFDSPNFQTSAVLGGGSVQVHT